MALATRPRNVLTRVARVEAHAQVDLVSAVFVRYFSMRIIFHESSKALNIVDSSKLKN